jgi:protein involved in polysaccharide export with SLBB domain
MDASRLHSVSLALALATACCGCAGSGGKMPINTATHRLLKATKDLRASYPEAMALPHELDKGVLTAYYVEPGDTLLVQPANLDSPIRLPTDQVVGPDGQIELGQYGRLQVVGKTPEEIERDVQKVIRAETKEAGPITVSLVGRQSKVYYVLGEVNSPGAYPLSGRETVLDAIIAAGGVTDAADLSGVTYTQPSPPGECRIVLPVCYREIVQLGDTSTNYQVAPGDRIYVPSMTLCQQLSEMLRKSPKPGCPPCGQAQWPCPGVMPQHISPGASIGTSAERLPTPKVNGE